MQVAYLLRSKVNAGNSTAVLFVKFFAYQLAFVLCTIASLLYMYPQLQAQSPQLIPIVIVGIAINGLWIIAIPLLFCAPVLHALAKRRRLAPRQVPVPAQARDVHRKGARL